MIFLLTQKTNNKMKDQSNNQAPIVSAVKKDVPMPANVRTNTNTKYGLGRLKEVGDCIEIVYPEPQNDRRYNSLKVSAHSFGKRHGVKLRATRVNETTFHIFKIA